MKCLKLSLSHLTSFSYLDPIPTSLLKQFLSALQPTLTNIINFSHASILLPFLINSNLAMSFLFSRNTILTKKTYPAIDLSLFFLSYLNLLIVLLKTALLRISLKIISSTRINLHRLHYSIESTLLAVHDHIIKSLSEPKVTALCLLDLSAAFDTIVYWSFYSPSSPFFLVWFWWHSYFLAYFSFIISKLCRFYQLYFLCSVSPSSRCSTRISPNWSSLIHTPHYSSQFSFLWFVCRSSSICWWHSIVVM